MIRVGRHGGRQRTVFHTVAHIVRIVAELKHTTGIGGAEIVGGIVWVNRNRHHIVGIGTRLLVSIVDILNSPTAAIIDTENPIAHILRCPTATGSNKDTAVAILQAIAIVGERTIRHEILATGGSDFADTRIRGYRPITAV